MIYLNNTTVAQEARFPMVVRPTATSFTLQIKKWGVQSAYTSVPVTYVSKSMLFATLSVTLPSGLADGDYEYNLKESQSIIGGGVLNLQGEEYIVREHETSNTYKEYNG